MKQFALNDLEMRLQDRGQMTRRHLGADDCRFIMSRRHGEAWASPILWLPRGGSCDFPLEWAASTCRRVLEARMRTGCQSRSLQMCWAVAPEPFGDGTKGVVRDQAPPVHC